MDKRRLRDSVNENWELLNGNDPTRLEGNNSSKQMDGDVDFTNLKDEEIDKLIEDLKTGKIQKLDLDTKDNNQNEEINIDDI